MASCMPCKRSARLSYTPVAAEDTSRSDLPYRSRVVHSGCISPQALEVVVSPNVVLKQMNDQIAVIQQHPTCVLESFGAEWSPPLVSKTAFHLFGHALDLTVGGSGGDEEEVGDPDQLGDVEYDDLMPLLLVDC